MAAPPENSQEREHDEDIAVEANESCASASSIDEKQSAAKRRSFSMKEKLQILRQLETESVESVCKTFGLNYSVLWRWKQKRTEIAEACKKEYFQNRKKNRTIANKDVDDALYTWFLRAQACCTPISVPVLQRKALTLNEQLGGPKNFKASNGWITRWKIRKGIRVPTITGEKLSANIGAANKYKEDFAKILRSKQFTRAQVFTFDKTGLSYKVMPKKTTSAKDENQGPGFKSQKDRVMIGACSNADGSLKLPLVVIGSTSPSPNAPNNLSMKNLPVSYKSQENSWMNETIFKDWFQNEFTPQVKAFFLENNLPVKALLIIDNRRARSFVKVEEMQKEFLSPTMSLIKQPLDQGILEALKRRYKTQLVTSILDEQENNNTPVDVYLKSVTVREVIRWINESWKDVSPTAIYKCWNKIWPSDIQSVAAQMEEESAIVTLSSLPVDAESEEIFTHGTTGTTEMIMEKLRRIRGYECVQEDSVREWMTAVENWGGTGAVHETSTSKVTGMPSSVTTKSKNLSFIRHRKKTRTVRGISIKNEELQTKIKMEDVKIEESTDLTEEQTEMMAVKQEPEDDVYPSYECVSPQENEDRKFDPTKLNDTIHTDNQKADCFRATIRKKQKTAQSPSHELSVACERNPEAPSTSTIDHFTIKEEFTLDDSESAEKLTLVEELKEPELVQDVRTEGRSPSIAHSSSDLPKLPDTTESVDLEMEHEFVSLGTWTEVTISDSDQEMEDEPELESILGTVEDEIHVVQGSRDVETVHPNSLYSSEQVAQVLPNLDQSSIYPPEQVAQVLPIVDPSSLYGSEAFGPCTDDLYVVPAGSSNSEQVTGSLENLSVARDYDSENVGPPAEMLGEIRCDLCSEWFDGMDNLIIHALMHHSLDQSQSAAQDESSQAEVPDKTYKCGTCRKTYKQLRNYKKHMALHNDERHKCNVCQKIFVRESYLIKHRLIHTPETQHECNMCNETFPSEAEMSSHMTIHTEDVKMT